MNSTHIETELKYIIDKIPTYDNVIYIEQSYFVHEPFDHLLMSIFSLESLENITTYRIRKIIDNNITKYYLTLKSKGSISRLEYETEIDNITYDLFKAKAINTIIKNRYISKYEAFTFEIDEYLNLKDKLISLEVELESDNENDIKNNKVQIENILKQVYKLNYKDVSLDVRYKNSNLLKYFG